jgi:hypothetical protein
MSKWKSRRLPFSCQSIILLLGWTASFSQYKITGYVMDREHMLIAGVTVSIKKSLQVGTMTDTSGKFKNAHNY